MAMRERGIQDGSERKRYRMAMKEMQDGHERKRGTR